MADLIRKAAFETLMETDEYPSVAVKRTLVSHTEWDHRDGAFYAALVETEVAHQTTIDAIIAAYSKTRLKKLDAGVLAAVRLALAQIFFLEKVPDSAACNESVKLLKASGRGKFSGFANGLIRHIIREKESPQARAVLGSASVKLKYINGHWEVTDQKQKAYQPLIDRSLRYSYPYWIVDFFDKKYQLNIPKEKSYNRGLKPYRFKGVEEFKDEIGWYTLVNMKDVWQIDMVGRSSSERLNYATQKPEALLDRLIKLVTDEGDLCGDFYCGSGTLAASAGRLGRRFICADVSCLAAANAVKRPLRAGYGFNVREIGRLPGRGSCSVSAHRDGSFIVLDSFATDEAAVPARYVESMRELLEKDPFALLDYWCAGRLDSDGTFVSMEPVFRNGRDGLPVSKEDVLREFTAVMAVDIFGRMSVCALH